MRRALLTIGVAVLLVLAGCNAGPDGGTATESTTTTPEPFVYPAGTSAEGVGNASALYAAHGAALNATGSYNATLVADSAGVANLSSSLTYVETAGEAGTFGRVAAGASTTETWTPADGPGTYYRSAAGGTSRLLYSVGETPTAGLFEAQTSIASSLLPVYLSLGEYGSAEVVTRSGTRMARYTATNVSADAAANVSAETVAEFEATLLVDAEGRIRAFDMTLAQERDGETLRTEVSYALTAVGSADPAAPDWTADAPTVAVERVGDGVLKLTNTAGSAFPAGTTLLAGGQPLSLEESLDSGASVYLAAGSSGGVTLTRTAPGSAAGTFDADTVVRVQTEGGTAAVLVGAASAASASGGN